MRTAALLLLAAASVAQDAPFALDAILVKPEELPKNVRLVEGIHCVSPQARNFFDAPAMKDHLRFLPPEMREEVPKEFVESFPTPKRTQCQSFQAEGGVPGSVLLFEYRAGETSEVLAFLEPDLWGGDQATTEHPEEVVTHGQYIWILSFPKADPAAEWYKARLRSKFHVLAYRRRPDLARLGLQIFKARDAKDAETGLRLLQENAKAVEDWSIGQHMLGSFAAMKNDHALAEKGYRRALELHDALVDPLIPQFAWATMDGLGLALHAQGKRPEAAKAFERAIEEAANCGEGAKKREGQSRYHLACAYSMMKKYPDALRALKEAIAANPQYKDIAKDDGDLAEARKRKEFQELLK